MSSVGNRIISPVTVLCIGGHDPSGGAGLQADIETVKACGGFANTIPSCLTVQNHQRVSRIDPVNSAQMRDMLNCLSESGQPDSIKIGLLGQVEQVELLSEWLAAMPQRPPVVLDPVIRATDGTQLSDKALTDSLTRSLLPLVTLLTPNRDELSRLGDSTVLDEAVQRLLTRGGDYILVTGGDTDTADVHNQLFGANGEHCAWHWERFPRQYHGTGCTLAAAAATYLAQGLAIQDACDRAQAFTAASLRRAITLKGSPLVPGRERA